MSTLDLINTGANIVTATAAISAADSLSYKEISNHKQFPTHMQQEDINYTLIKNCKLKKETILGKEVFVLKDRFLFPNFTYIIRNSNVVSKLKISKEQFRNLSTNIIESCSKDVHCLREENKNLLNNYYKATKITTTQVFFKLNYKDFFICEYDSSVIVD